MTHDAQLAELAKFGPEIAILAIEQSIRNQWVGLFPSKLSCARNDNLFRRRDGSTSFDDIKETEIPT